MNHLDVRRSEIHALVDRLREQESTELVCSALGIGVSSYYERKRRRLQIDVKRRILRARVKRLFDKSRQSAGARTIVGMLRDEGIEMGRFKAGRLMKEQGLNSKQPGKHAYKQAKVERPDIPNLLNRQFVPEQPNQAWCGDITYCVLGVQH